MRQKVFLCALVLMLTGLFSLMGLFVRNASCKLMTPEVDVTPSVACIGQQVLVKAKINVASCWGDYDVRDMQASLTFPTEGDLISGDNPVYFGNVSRGESRTVNWTLVFNAGGKLFELAVNASGYRQDTGEPVQTCGSATVKVDATPPVITILSPQNVTYPTSEVPLNFMANELTHWIGYSLDNQPNATYYGSTAIPVPEGRHALVVYANDTVGNMGASYTVWFSVDVSPPIIETPTRVPAGDVEPYQEVTVSVNATDEISDVETVILSFQNDTSWYNITMGFNPMTSLYEASIPGQSPDTLVKYKAIAHDEAGHFAVNDNEEEYFVYTVIPEFSSAVMLFFLLAVATFLVVLGKKKY